MLFQVTTTINIPSDLDPQKVAEVSADEKEKAKQLQQEGKLRHIWRIAGKKGSVLIFEVESPDELHALLSSLPFFPYMNTEVAALCRHPNAI